MQLKKETKEKIMMQLVVKATKKHGPAMGKAAKALDDLFRAAVIKNVQAALPELTPTRWVDLIQAGVMTRFSSMKPTVYLPVPGRTDGSYSSYGVGHANVGCDTETADFYWDLKRLMAEEGWAKFVSYVEIEKRYGNFSLKWKMSYSDLPGLNLCSSMDIREGKQDAWSGDAWPLHEQAHVLNSKFIRVLEEAKAFYDDLQIIFAGIRTEKQLIDQFPEAAKLLPPPPPKRQDVAPKDLIERANRILETGIPN